MSRVLKPIVGFLAGAGLGLLIAAAVITKRKGWC